MPSRPNPLQEDDREGDAYGDDGINVVDSLGFDGVAFMRSVYTHPRATSLMDVRDLIQVQGPDHVQDRIESSHQLMEDPLSSNAIYQAFRSVVIPKMPCKVQIKNSYIAYKRQEEREGESLPRVFSDFFYRPSYMRTIEHESDLEAAYVDMMMEIAIPSDGPSDVAFVLAEVHVRVANFIPVQGQGYVPLPDFIKRKNAIVNPVNVDDECFLWALTAGLCYHGSGNAHNLIAKDPQELYNLRPFRGMITTPQGSAIPPRYEDYARFEEVNNFSFNVWELHSVDEVNKKFKLTIRYHTKKVKTHHVNLLLFKPEPAHEFGHYMSIYDMSRLISGMKSHHKAAVHHCNACLHSYSSKHAFDAHKKYKCEPPRSEDGSLELPARLPELDKRNISFKNDKHATRAPINIYADMETFPVKLMDIKHRDPECTDQLKSETRRYQHHKCCSAAFVVRSAYERFDGRRQLIQTNTSAKDFIRSITNLADEMVTDVRKTYKDMTPCRWQTPSASTRPRHATCATSRSSVPRRA